MSTSFQFLKVPIVITSFSPPSYCDKFRATPPSEASEAKRLFTCNHLSQSQKRSKIYDSTNLSPLIAQIWMDDLFAFSLIHNDVLPPFAFENVHIHDRLMVFLPHLFRTLRAVEIGLSLILPPMVCFNLKQTP